ncbi:MAG: ElyC/SanA/YdcF family protein [Acidimicrobiales bacterium]
MSAAMVVVLLLVARWRIGSVAAGRVASSVEAVPHRRVALVLGAGLEGDGSPGPMLRDRLDGAVALYRAGVVDHLLLSGDNGRTDHDEPTAMRRRVIAAGVPPLDVTLDFAGFDTADSCERARRVFGVTDAVVVTQRFHLDRAVYLCRLAGIDAVGFTPPVSPDATGGLGALAAREWLAGAKAMVEAEVLHTEPTFGGPFEGLSGSVVPANGP